MESADSEKKPQSPASPDPALSNGSPAAPEADPNDSPYDERMYKPKTPVFWLVIFSNLMSLFLVALDKTIITTAIPDITNDFNSLDDIGWYVSAYMLASAIAQLLYGRIYRHYDMKTVFLASIFLFEVGSAVCGAAPNSRALIAGRAIAGFAGSGIFAGCMLVIIPMVPLHIRPKFQGLFGMVFGIASVTGPLIGGAFTKSVTWRWCFYLNLPIGAFSWTFMLLAFHPEKKEHPPASAFTHLQRLDPLGMLFFAPSMVCLMLALQWGGTAYAWSSGRILALLVVFAVLIVAFCVVQVMRPTTASIPARIVMERSIFCTSVYTFCVSAGWILLIYYVPVWFETVKGFSPTKSGVQMFPLTLSMIVSTLSGGFTTHVLGYYVPAMLIGPTLMAIGLGLQSAWNLHTTMSNWIGLQFLSGFGLGFGLQISGLVVQRVLPHDDIPLGIALLFFLQQLGGSIFNTVGENLLINILVSRLVGVVPGLDTNDIINGGATGLIDSVPGAADKLVVRHAYNYAVSRIFLTAMGVTLAGLVSVLGVKWLSIKKGKDGQGDAEAAKTAKAQPGDGQPTPKAQAPSLCNPGGE